MFYCDDCAKKWGWPKTFLRTFRPCDSCGMTRTCNEGTQPPRPPPCLVGKFAPKSEEDKV